MEERLTGWLLAVVVLIVATGWLVVFVIMPAVRSDDFKPPPEVNIALMGALGAVVTIWRKARKPDTVPPPDEEAE